MAILAVFMDSKVTIVLGLDMNVVTINNKVVLIGLTYSTFLWQNPLLRTIILPHTHGISETQQPAEKCECVVKNLLFLRSRRMSEQLIFQ